MTKSLVLHDLYIRYFITQHSSDITFGKGFVFPDTDKQVTENLEQQMHKKRRI